MSDAAAVQPSDQSHQSATVDLDALAKQHGASLSDAPQQPQGGALYRFGTNLGRQVNPVSAVQGAAQLTAHPIDSWMNDTHQREQVWQEMKDDWDAGNHGAAAARFIYSMVPFMGPQMNDAANKFRSGDFAGGAGQSTGLGIMMAAPSALKGAVPAVGRIGAKLTDYAPQIGEAVQQGVKWSGRGAPVVGALMRGNVEGAIEGGLGTVAGELTAPIAGKAAAAVAKGTGAGMQWLGNLLSADASGLQPLPLTKRIINNSGLVQQLQQHLNSQEPQQLALPPGPIELGPSSASASPEGVLPAQKIIVRDPHTGQMKAMYGSGTGPTVYQGSQPPADAINVLSPEQIRSFKIADNALESMQEWERRQNAQDELNKQTGPRNEPSPEMIQRMNTPERSWGRPNAPGSIKLPTVRDNDMSVVMQDNQPYYRAVDKQLEGMTAQQASDLAKSIGSNPDRLRLDLAKHLKQQDTDMSSLLQRSIDQAQGKQGGHAGGGVASVEELNRPGVNYVVTKGGNLTYQGKSFAPESTPSGASHVTVLPNGQLRVNAGPALTASQEIALRNALRQ